jgi:hypothetical protein
MSLGQWRWKEDRTWILWFLLATPWAFFLVRKDGSHVHYFFESVVSGSVVLTLSAWRLLTQLRLRSSALSLVVLTAVVLSTLIGWPLLSPKEWRSGAYFHAQQVKAYVRHSWWSAQTVAPVMERIRAGRMPSLLLSQTATLAIECGRDAIFDVGDFVRLQAMGRFDSEERLLPMVRGGEFPVIGVQEFEDTSQEARFGMSSIKGLAEAIEAHYDPLMRTRNISEGRIATFSVPRR